jgi:hypothetical protein
VTITDSLDGTAAARGVTTASLAIRAAQAGTDMIMLTGTEAASQADFDKLLAAVGQGTIPTDTLRASYDRILALKATLARPVADATAPSADAPVSRLYAPSTIGVTTAPVRTSWSAVDPCGVSAFGLERAKDGGAWAVQGLPGATVTSVAQSLAFGSAWRYAVRATDGAGNMGGRVDGPAIEPLVRESATVVRFAGAWGTALTAGYSGGSTRYASVAGSSASYTFTGSSIGWVAAIGPTRGSAKVYLDGVYRTTVSLDAAATALRRVVYATSWASQGTHTIRIVVAGTAAHPRVDVDAFVRLYRH